jgi:hypothetical protein
MARNIFSHYVLNVAKFINDQLKGGKRNTKTTFVVQDMTIYLHLLLVVPYLGHTTMANWEVWWTYEGISGL